MSMTMYIRVLLGLLLTAFWCATFAQTATEQAENEKPVIAVMSQSDFVPDRVAIEQAPLGLPDSLAARIIKHLVQSKRFEVVERRALRRSILEQRFGQRLKESYLDRTLNKAIEAMDSVQGGSVKGSSREISGSVSSFGASLSIPLPIEPRPVGSGITEGAGDVGTIGALADYNDILKDFLDLGTSVGAQYIVIGSLEKLDRSSEAKPVPYTSGQMEYEKKTVDARLRLRVVNVEEATVTGATSLQRKVEEIVFQGEDAGTSRLAFLDQLGRLAAVKVLDMTFPARLVSMDPPVVSRGKNEGIKSGDVFRIVREGKIVRDSNGVKIGHLHQEVGRVQVSAVQERFSVVTALDDAQLAKGDLALLGASDPAKPGEEPPAESPRKIAKSETDNGGRPRVAVGLIKSGSTARTGDDADEHTPIFTDTMISRLTQTRRFQMVDRQEVDQLLEGQLAEALAEQRGLPTAMGTLQGVDYFVYGSLASFGVEDSQVKLPDSSQVIEMKTGHAEGNIRIVDVRSGDILESRKISVSSPVDVQAKGSRVVAALADKYAAEVVETLMNAVYPIKVAAVGNDGAVYINRGRDGGLVAGQVLEAFRPGEPVIDPDTGVQLGVEEVRTGTVTVEDVEDARSKGVVSEGGMDIAKGHILKRRGAAVGTSEEMIQTAASSRSASESPAGDKLSSPGPVGLAVGDMQLNPSGRNAALTQSSVSRITNDLITKLATSKRFTVLERQQVDQVLDEKAYEAISSGRSIREYLQQLHGADYLVHGEITDFYTEVVEKEIPYLEEKETYAKAVAEGTLRIVDTKAGAVVAAEKIRFDSTSQNVGSADQTEVLSTLIDKFTTRSVAQIVENLFPIKVLGSNSDGTIYVNRGANAGLEVGDEFNVMRPGEELTDPDTGLSFGSTETKVGTAEIVHVESARARARLQNEGVAARGDILRVPQGVEDDTRSVATQPDW